MGSRFPRCGTPTAHLPRAQVTLRGKPVFAAPRLGDERHRATTVTQRMKRVVEFRTHFLEEAVEHHVP